MASFPQASPVSSTYRLTKLTNQLTPHSSLLLDNLAVIELSLPFPPFRTAKVHCSPPLEYIQSQMNHVQILALCFLKCLLILLSHLHPGLPGVLFPSGLPTIRICVCYMPNPSYPKICVKNRLFLSSARRLKLSAGSTSPGCWCHLAAPFLQSKGFTGSGSLWALELFCTLQKSICCLWGDETRSFIVFF